MKNPPVTLAKIAIGDGSIASVETCELLPVVSVLETYPQIIGYDTDVFEYFREQEKLCGYDLTLEYPQNGHFPTLNYTSGANASSGMSTSGRYRARQGRSSKGLFLAEMEQRYNAHLAKRSTSLSSREHVHAADAWKRDLADRANGTIDPWYGCDVYDEMLDYAINFTFPWSLSGGTFDVYDIPDALNPEAPSDASVFLNDPRTRSALHAPTSQHWQGSIGYPFDNNYSNNDPSVEPMAFLTDLATNATAKNVSVVVFSGNDDSLLPHLGSQGHLVGNTNPQSGFVLIREFIFGNNQTGLVTNTSGKVTVVGGEVSSLANEIMTGQAAIYYGSATTESAFYFPTATVKAWNAYIPTATIAQPTT
ncbi:hypothetical protein AZE42_01195 [Rhizopogon vesiculosus]|uniref:Uncharacterized protein n=1 Tax=Rhizopogon vesiculosus TaxID=180088 RepID=A0A1J8PLJ8_9AGAM|nr:hypothetical protein AZE42_01195 [Rhizopogon vesiculosus]